MKLLVLTQKVDEQDDVLGFFHEWLKRFAAQCETVEVICLFEGQHDLPVNVHVYSLGKEKGMGKIHRTLRFFNFLWSLRGQYDGVFIHMNPEYLVLVGWWWSLARIPTLLWYSHRNVDLKLRIAETFVTAVASSASSSFKLRSSKLHVVGHGIDTQLFAPSAQSMHAPWRMVSVGRITPIKRLETAVEALALLRQRGVDAELVLVGQATVASDRSYEQMLRARVKALAIEPYVHFVGAVPYSGIPAIYQSADVSINLAPTGGLDKAVLESMAASLPTLVSNEGFVDFLGPYQERLLFNQDDAADLAEKLTDLYHSTDKAVIEAYIRGQVITKADLDALIMKLLSILWPNK